MKMQTSHIIGFSCGLISLVLLYGVLHLQLMLKMVPFSLQTWSNIDSNHTDLPSLNKANGYDKNLRNGIYSKKPLKQIVLWNTFFGRNDWGIGYPKGQREKEISCFGKRRCILSINRTDVLRYDAVVFHARDHHTPPVNRSANQIYIMYVWESPAYRSNSFQRGNSFYNWTSTYSKKSDIIMLHGEWYKLPVTEPDALKVLPQFIHKRKEGTAMVLWIISHCGGASRRFAYADELKKHIKVDIYGGCGKPCPNRTGGNSPSCYDQISATGQYKFYLAFENSACQDYISLKPYRALNSSFVPVVLGGASAKDYLGLFPPNSYIDVRNFSSPKALADYLNLLDQNDEQYLAYHAWRKDYRLKDKRTTPYCQICEALYNNSMTKPRNVNWGEFWNPGTKCDSRLVSKLLSGNYTEHPLP